MAFFAVIRTQGAAWQPSLPLEGQPDWNAHAAFMNELQKEGFISLGGPLLDTPEVLLIVRADCQEDIVARLADDPWSASDLLSISRISPWALRLGSL